MTVPAGAKLACVGVSGFGSGAGYFTGGSVTLDGAAMTVFDVNSDANFGFFQGGAWYKVTPSTGTVTLAWDWTGASNAAQAAITIAFWDDVVGAVRDTDGVQQAGNPHTSGTLTAQSGDLLIAYGFADSNGSTATWTSATERSDTETGGGGAMQTFADTAPSGNQTVSWSGTTGIDGGVTAVVFQSGAAPGGSWRLGADVLPMRRWSF